MHSSFEPAQRATRRAWINEGRRMPEAVRSVRFARALSMPERLARALEQAGEARPGRLPSPKRPGLDAPPEPTGFSHAKADAQAAPYGPDLASLVQGSRPLGAAGWRLPQWTSVTRPGWKLGGPLGLACEDCGRKLQWVDWWNASGVRMRNNAIVFCPVHGGPVTHHRGEKLQRLVWARQQLDSSVYPPGKGQGRYAVYAYEILGLARSAVYVGETTKTVEARYAEHVEGVRSPQVIRGGRGQVGPLRQKLVKELPPLTSDTAALSAQHWVHLSLLHLGYAVYGDGKR